LPEVIGPGLAILRARAIGVSQGLASSGHFIANIFDCS